MRSVQTLNRKRSTHWYQGPRQERASENIREFEETTRQTFIDKIVLEILRLVQSSPALQSLVNQNDLISYEQLKRSIGDYSSLDFKPLETAALELFQRILSGTRSRKALHQIAMEIDVLKDFIDLETFQAMVLEAGITHYRRLIHGLKIPERRWKATILALHKDCFLEAVGPVQLWCTHCPEAGVLASVRATELLRPIKCPLCGRVTFSAAALLPAEALDAAIRLRDGVLGAAIGWQLKKRGIPFRHSVDVDGTEFDFLLSCGDTKCLIECKMNHQIKEDTQHEATLLDNFAQLKAHVLAAQSANMALHCALCVTNHTRSRLAKLKRTARLSQDSSVPTQLISYEDFIPWLDQHSPAFKREGISATQISR